MDLSIIIVNYNSTEYLEDCLKSLEMYTNGITFEIIVVDNNSTDRTIETFNARFPRVRFIFRNINDGFGAACNYGFKSSTGKYICLVNPDIIISNNILYKYYRYMEANNDVMCCSSLLVDNSGELTNSYDNFPSIFSEFRDFFYFPQKRHLKNLIHRKEINNKEIFEVDYHIGAFLFLRKEGYEAIKGFDERFFLYSEDIDFGLRLKNLGKKIVCISEERIFHYTNCTVKSSKGKFIRTYHINRSKMIYMYKHYGFFQRNLSRIIMISSGLLRLLFVPFNPVHKGSRVDGIKRILMGMKLYFKKYNLVNMDKYAA